MSKQPRPVLGDDPFGTTSGQSAGAGQTTPERSVKGSKIKAGKSTATKTKPAKVKAVKAKATNSRAAKAKTKTTKAKPATAKPRPAKVKSSAAKTRLRKPAAKTDPTRPQTATGHPGEGGAESAGSTAAAGAPGLAFLNHTDAAPLADGAAARRAANATASLGETLAESSPSNAAGPSIDDREGAPGRAGSLSEEIHRIERRLIRKERAGLQGRTGDLSLLDRVGRLLDARHLRGKIIDRKMRFKSDTVDNFGLDPIRAEGWRPILEFMYRSYWRVETSGMENIPDHGRAIIVANHAGTLPYDGAMIMCAVRYDHPAHRTIRPLVEDFIFHFPFIGAALNRIGCVRACQDNAERLLRQEQLVAVFPEGMKGISKLYRHRYQLQRFGRGGFIKLALQTRAPIIPAAVIGAEEIYPMMGRVTWLAKYLGIPYVPLTPTFPWLGALGAIPLPSKWQIHFGDPLYLADQFGTDAADDRILVNQLAEKVRSTIQSMVDEGLASRRSVIFG